MLVLTRKTGERIVIAGGITIEVLQTQGNRVRIGIEAPRGVSIRRQELLLREDSHTHGEDDVRLTGQAPPCPCLEGPRHP
jgi:carbon storage regulator CsrA